MASWSPKDPGDVADYWFDWSTFLPAAQSISSATVTVPSGITSVASDFTSKVVRVRLSGGTAGAYYAILCAISTDTGESFEISKNLAVQGRVVL